MTGWHMTGWGGGIYMWLLLILFIVLLVYILKKAASANQTDSPLDTLKKRYARGDMSKDEFEAMKKDIL